MRELSQVLRDATGSIERRYFHLAADGGGPIYRERVYCYELYHQMRSRWPRDCPYCLNGEIDKAAHPILTKLGVGRAIPDLLVHQPGDMLGNYAIIEVKNLLADPGEIKKDLKKLSLFVCKVGYHRAIYLSAFVRQFLQRRWMRGSSPRMTGLFNSSPRISPSAPGRAPRRSA